ncbi:MAG: cupin domain-containing protein [Bacteroidetes bacterium]|nr:MAG: cupin domain-containing protein [Bacteroidota bacterium]
MKTAEYWIARLGMTRHPEGGWFSETYRSAGEIPADALPARYGTARSFSTAIYFLIEGHDFSAFHRISSDEGWHFYAGSRVTLYQISPEGQFSETHLGPDPESGEQFQTVVPAQHWFGARVQDPQSYALVGCTVAPGFDFADFELATRPDLLAAFPQHAAWVEALTRP